MSENDFLNQVIDLGKLYGWHSWHIAMPMRPIGKGEFVPDSRGRGLPDLIMLREDPPQVLFAELKKRGKKATVTVQQRKFLRLVEEVGSHLLDGYAPPIVQAFLWDENDMEQIKAALSARGI